MMDVNLTGKQMFSQSDDCNLYQRIVEDSRDGIVIVQNDTIKYANKAFCVMLGYTIEELLCLNIPDLMAPWERERITDIHNRRVEGTEDLSVYTATMIQKDSSGIDVELTANTIDYEGRVAYLISARDITERNRMQEAVEQSTGRFRDLAEMLPQTVYEMTLEGRQTYVNRAGIEAFRYNSSPIGRSAFDFIAPEDHARMRENMKRSVTDNDFTSGNEYTGVRDDGSRFPLLVYGSPIYDKGEVVGTRGIIIDISERKAMENALLESEKKYRTVIDNATDGIVITQQGKLRFLNTAMCEMLLYEKAEILEKPFLDYVIKEDHQIMIDLHKRRMEGEEFTSLYSSHFIRKDGEVITVELNTRTSDYNGEPAAFNIIRNISDRAKIENELKTARLNLELLNRDLEQRVIQSSESLTEARTQLIKLQKENLQSQFDVLKQQVNPHFLFNSLNVLTSLIKLDPDLAEKFSEQLSKVYRYVLENKDNELVDLNTELIFLDAYIFLLNIRFVNKLIVNINIPESKRSEQIIPLAMQLLIENAIKHNIMSKSNPLHIDIFIDKDDFLNIVNNLQERPSQIISTGVGLKNIQNRYLLLNNTQPSFEKTETQFIAKVPLVLLDSNALNT